MVFRSAERPTEQDPRLIDDRAEYSRNLRRLRLARDVWNLEEGRTALMLQLGPTTSPTRGHG